MYGPRDNLFLPNMLETAGQGLLRIFGNGKNRICFSHVDNYCHGLILGYPALYAGSPALGNFYIVVSSCSLARSPPPYPPACLPTFFPPSLPITFLFSRVFLLSVDARASDRRDRQTDRQTDRDPLRPRSTFTLLSIDFSL